MAEVEVNHDAFADAVQNEYDVYVTKETITVYFCDCGCLFFANLEPGYGWYPDRFEKEYGGCTIPRCKCHEIPNTIDLNGKETSF